jgi:hypothetical protein
VVGSSSSRLTAPHAAAEPSARGERSKLGIRVEESASPRWDISALEAVLGPRREDAYPDFRSQDASMRCWLHTAGTRDDDRASPQPLWRSIQVRVVWCSQWVEMSWAATHGSSWVMRCYSWS